MGNASWDNFELERGESKTILCRFADVTPTKADVEIAIYYQFLAKKWRSYHRFQGIHIESWEWSKQPVGNVAMA